MHLASACCALSTALVASSSPSCAEALPSPSGVGAGARAGAARRELQNKGGGNGGGKGGGQGGGGGGSSATVPAPAPVDGQQPVEAPIPDIDIDPGEVANGTLFGLDGEILNYDDLLEETLFDALAENPPPEEDGEDDEEEKMWEDIVAERLPRGAERPKKSDAYRPKGKGKSGAAGPSKKNEKENGGKAAEKKARALAGDESLSPGDLLKLQKDQSGHRRGLTVATHTIGTFSPLSCNPTSFDGADCSAGVSSLGWDAASTLVIPCGTCLTWDLGDTMLPEGMDVQGKLVFPPDYAATINTTHVVVQGELEITSTKAEVSTDNRSLRFILTGTADKSFLPVDSNADACDSHADGLCPIGKKAFVVAGGRLDIRALGEDAPTWTRLLGLARGQASPLAAGEYDTPPSYPTDPTCSADGAIVRETFASGAVPPCFSGEKGAYFEIGPEGEMVVSNRQKEWQGPYLDVTSALTCVVPDATYLLTIRYKLDHEDPTKQGQSTVCDETGQNCLWLHSQMEKLEGGHISTNLWGTGSTTGEKYGEWVVASKEVTFSAEDADPTDKVYWTLLLRGAEPGVTVSVSSFELVPPDAEHYASDGTQACQELVPGGNGDLHGLNTYPFAKNMWQGTLSKATETLPDSSTNNYFKLVGRLEYWNSLKSFPNVGCLQTGLTYTISYKLRVHTSVPVDSRTKFVWTKADGSQGQRDGITRCQNQQTLSDGWVECRRDFTVDEALSSEPVPGSLYWEIFLEGAESDADAHSSDVDYDDLSISQKGGPVEGLLLPGSVAGRWGPGSEIHVTSGTYEGDHSQNAVVASVADRGDGTAAVALQSMLGSPAVTEEDMPGYGAEVALLTRNVVIEGSDEEPDQGGYVQVLHTPGVAQTIEGVELRNMGQLSLKNRFPLQLLYSGSVNGTSISRNSIVHSNQRCISVDGTSDAAIEGNTAHDTAGMCFYAGYESSNNLFRGNLGSVISTKINWLNRLEGDSDHEGTTFFLLQPNNHLIGNVAAGSPWDGYRILPSWWTPGEDGSDIGVNGRRLPLGSFEDNVAHSNYKGLYVRDLEQVYEPDGHPNPVFAGFRSYRNKDWGAYIWASLGASFLGGEVAENRYGLGLHYSEDLKVHNFSITGLTDETVAHLNAIGNSWKMCNGHGQEGLAFSAAVRDMYQKAHRLRGIDAKNLTIGGFDSPDRCPDSRPVRIWSDNLQNLHWNMHAQFDGMSLGHAARPAVDLCPAVNAGVDDAIIIDVTGDLDPAGLSAGPGSIVANNAKMTALALGGCAEHADGCLSYCAGTCYRTLTYRADRDYTAAFILKITDAGTGKFATTSGKTFEYDGDAWQETFDDWRRGRFFSLPLPAGSGPFDAVFLDADGNEVWPRWAEEWWEPSPSCADAPGPGSVTLIRPELTPADMDAVVANGGLDDGTACWKHNGAGNEIHPIGTDGSPALKSADRNNAWQYHGQYLDMRPLLADPESLHEISARIKITSKATGAAVSCSPNGEWYNGGCPRVTFRFTYHEDDSVRDGQHFHWYYGDMARVTVEHDAENLSRMSGVIKPVSRFDHFTANGGAHTLLLYIEYGPADWQFTIDDLAVRPLPRPGTCDDNLVHNSDFSEGDSRYWYWNGWGAQLSMAEGVGGQGDLALRAFDRTYAHMGARQHIDVGSCYSPGDKIEITAKYRLEDKTTREEATWACVRQGWGGSNGCLDVLNHQTTAAGSRSDRGGRTVATPDDGAPGGWATVKGYYTVQEGYGSVEESYLYFDAGSDFDTIVDDVQVRRIPPSCSNLLMNPAVDETSAYWLPGWDTAGVLSLVSPGAGGSGHALKFARSRLYWHSSFYQDADLRCVNEGEELTVTGKFRLLDGSTGEAVTCDPNLKYNSPESCPKVVIEGWGCDTADGWVWLTFWNEKPFFAWDPDAFNDFEASFVVSASLKSCTEHIRLHVARDLDPAYDVVADDFKITPPIPETDGPTPSPVAAGPAPAEDDGTTSPPTAAPTLAPTSTVQSCPEAGSAPTTVAAGPTLLSRSSDLCLLTKVPASGGTPVPIGRSYLSHDWEYAGGAAAEDVAAPGGGGGNGWKCYASGCQIDLPALDAGWEYRLSSHARSLDGGRDRAARLLESATFGPRMGEATALGDAADVDAALAGWVESQMGAVPMTSHREYWRRHMNMQYDSTQSFGTTDHPCDPLSRWRRYSATRFDSIWSATHTLSTAPLGPNGTEPYSVTIDGHVRTVVLEAEFGQFHSHQVDENGAQYAFEFGREYEICGADYMNLNVRMDDESCRYFPAPTVHFPPEFEALAGDGVLDLSADALSPINVPNVDGSSGNELILDGAPTGLTGPECDNIPPFAEVGDAPVFGKLSDGTWVQWDARTRLRDNAPGAPLANDAGEADGGGSLQLATGGTMLCSNAPRTFLNEESCVLSGAASACNSAPMPEIHIDLSEDNIAALHNLTKDDDGNGRYVYAIDGLPVEDEFSNLVPHPCTYGQRSRWRLKDVASEGPCAPTPVDPVTNETLFGLLHMSSDPHPYLRDVEVSATLGEEGTPCSPSDSHPSVEMDVAGRCWVHVHPDHLSVYDMTFWAGEDAHPGNMIAATDYDPPKTNPIKRWMDVSGSSVLVFPASSPQFPHPITRWENNRRRFDYVGRLGDSVRFRDLPSLLRLDRVAEHFSADEQASVRSTSVLVCGSPGEVASDPTLGDKFELSTGRDPSWWLGEQREWVWTEVALGGADQLRQRVAWSLAQLLVVVKDAIDSQWRKTEAFLAYHDIFVRNAFGNYLDILREVSYNPLMSENLSYLNSRSASYVYETQRKHSFADENYAREIMQLFTVGLVQLNLDGRAKRDPETGETIPTYTNEHIMSFARVWTGFGHQQRRGNVEEPDWSGNAIDPMRITADWRDKFPKSDLDGGYLGDGYPLCVDLPERMHLRKGATYRLIGGSNLPELMEDPVEFATDADVRKLELAAGSALGAELCADDGSGCAHPNTVTLPSTLPCAEGSADVECNVGTVRTVKVSPTSDVYYEYVRPACVEQIFYSDAVKLSQRHASSRTICANPRLPVASEACCAVGSTAAERNNIYDGERMTKATAASRCAELGLYECDFSHVEHSAWYFAPNHFWAKDPCLVRVKVKSDSGYAAAVYEPDGYYEKEYHVDDANRNYFKVYWEGDGTYPSPDNNCGEGACQSLSTGGCLCDTSVASSRVFDGMPRSAEEALGALRIGALDPLAHDLVAEDGYAAEPQTVPNVVAYTVNGAYDEDTIFVVTDEVGRVRRLKNSAETVRIIPVGGGSATGMSFRNAPTFMSLVPSEATVRDARYETEAALEHYFYQESTAPFVSVRLIQRMVSSNPSPRYVKAVATAFRTGTYSAPSGQTFGRGRYGDMAAAVAAVLLDREARTPLLDADPSTGYLREPLLKVMGLMRSMEYEQLPQYDRIEMWNMQDKIGQMSHEFPSVFSFFLPEHVPNGRIGEAGLVGPVEMLLDMPKTVSLLNGMFGLIKHGLSDCNNGFGNWHHGFVWGGCDIEGQYTRAQGQLTLNVTGTPGQVVDDLATLLTAGRLSSENRAIIQAAYEGAADAAEGLRLAQQLVASTPEFHATNIVKKSGEVRPPPEAPQASGSDYKAIVYLMFAGGADSYNMLAPKYCSAKDLYSEYVTVREQVALGLHELLDINATGQICETFGVHDHLPAVASMYNDGDLLFFANTGVMTMPVTKDDYYLNTVTPLFAHNHMQREAMRVDPLEEKSNTGVVGRMSDALTAQGLSVGSFSVDHNSISLIGEPGLSSTPFIVSQHGISEFNPGPSGTNMSQTIKDLNAATAHDSGYFAETWSSKLIESMGNNELLHATLQGTEPSVEFPDTWLGRKLRTVARMIATKEERGVDRDMFFVDVGGWDTHADVRDNLIDRFTEVNDALAAFRDELKSPALDMWDRVTTIQTSDFARTLAPNTGDGTDHAWGGNYMLFGGAVAGGQVRGAYPDDLTDDGPLGLGRGRLIPGTPWDAAFYGLAEWVGVEAAAMPNICPNAGAFPEGTMFSEADLFKSVVRKQRYLRN